MLRVLFCTLLFAASISATGIPVVESYTSNNSGGGLQDSIRLGKPSGVATGDLLLVMVGNDNMGVAPSFQAIPDWTQFVHQGDADSDCKLVCYWRIADGTEADTIQVDCTGDDEIWGWYIRVSGVDDDRPIDDTGSAYVYSYESSHAITEATSTVDSCLGFYVLAFDGGDGYPFGISGTGWTEEDEQQSGSDAVDASGVWGTKELATHGGTGTATVSSSVSDGATGIQFVVAPFRAVDTLSDTSDIYDAVLYNYANCDGDVVGEDCFRYNAGGLYTGRVGTAGGNFSTIVMSFPGWDGVVPDSSELVLYCLGENATTDKDLICYPLTTAFIEGNELKSNAGDYPNPDSGVTWNHAYLDDGDADSLNWTTAGGDYTTAVACTVSITNATAYFSLKPFNRILNYMDTSSTYYGVRFLVSPATPLFNTGKTFRLSETGTGTEPRLILYTTEAEDTAVGQVIIIQ